MLRSLLSGVLRSRTGAGVGSRAGGLSGGGAGGLGGTHRSGTSDPGAAVGAQVGRSLFSALRRRR